MTMYSKITDFVHQLYGNSEFVPLSVPVFCGNEKNILKNVLIPHS